MKQSVESKTAIPTDEESLDPDNWQAYRSLLHAVLDQCVDRMESVSDNPWIPPDKDALTGTPLPCSGTDMSIVAQTLVNQIMPYATGNTHPAFFGWVHGSGLASGLLSAMVEATMNSNCGGRDHGAVYIERQLISWCLEIFGWPDDTISGGIVTSGTSSATLIALTSARTRVLGKPIRRSGIKDFSHLCVYVAKGTHNCISKALDIMGIGTSAIREIPLDAATNSMCLKKLAGAIQQDKDKGFLPLCVVGNAGTVNVGRFDDLDAIGQFCESESIWFHIDGAYGAWIKLADPRWSNLSNGIERADSLAFDFHKWMSVQYDAGAVLIKNKQWLIDSFGDRPAYLKGDTQGLAGGAPWYCEQGIELSRGFRALKVWTALQVYGIDAFGQQITQNCEQAELMGTLVEASPKLELVRDVTANVCCFKVVTHDLPNEQLEAMHNDITAKLQYDGAAVLSTTTIDDRSAIRAAMVNHRTQASDITATIDAVLKELG